MYSTGRYGIVDPFYRHIWLNVHDEKIAHKIRKLFWAKAPAIVFDLTQFKNYTESTVDSDVSLNWKIPEAPYSSHLVGGTATKKEFETTQTTYCSDILINEANHSHLPMDRQVDVQQQMLLYYNMMWRIIHPAIKFDEHLLKEFDQIFQKELFLKDIKEKLYQLANTVNESSFGLAWIILDETGRLYE